MVRSLMFVVIALFFGCATSRATLTLPWDYFPRNKPPAPAPATSQLEKLGHKIDQLEEMNREKERADVAEHYLSVAPVWSFVLSGSESREVYTGLTLTGTIPSNILSFKLMVTWSRDFIESTNFEVAKFPELFGITLPIQTIAKVKVVSRAKDYIVMPAITLPIVHFKVKFNIGARSFVTSAELRTGMAYDLYFRYSHSEYYISLFDGDEKKLSLPSGISDNGYPSSLTTINLDFAPLHLEANLIGNARGIKVALGIGVIW